MLWIPGTFQGQVGWVSEQHSVVEAVPVHGRGLGRDGAFQPQPFCDSNEWFSSCSALAGGWSNLQVGDRFKFQLCIHHEFHPGLKKIAINQNWTLRASAKNVQNYFLTFLRDVFFLFSAPAIALIWGIFFLKKESKSGTGKLLSAEVNASLQVPKTERRWQRGG